MSKTVELNIPRTAEDRVAKAFAQPSDEQIKAAMAILNAKGFNISAPWDGDLDDLEKERFRAVQDAIRAVLEVKQR